MITVAEIKNIIQTNKQQIEQAILYIELDKKKQRIAQIESILESEANWSDNSKMAALMQEKSRLQKIIENADSVSSFISNTKELVDMAEEMEDQVMLLEIADDLLKKQSEIKSFEIASLFKDDEDKMDCFIEINSGAGGTESQDWVQMLLRMYTMWAEKNGFTFEILDKIHGEEAGFKQVIANVKGYLAYGHLKNENGVHRLVRISPFNAQHKRQTSFASIFCYPAIDDTINIEVLDKDIRIDTYKSSGAGGQHINTTDSAVRITHIPTNIAVQSQTQRSQMQNKAEAMKMLKSKLYEIEITKRNTDKDNIEKNKSAIDFGSQIRNYVLHPYQLIKDLRSNYETSQSNKVLDGDIQEIIYSVLLAGK